MVSGNAASVAVSREGVTTLTYFAKNNVGDEETPKALALRVDKTRPIVNYAGNGGVYQLDQTVNITCSTADSLSGVISHTCANIGGPAYSFQAGINAFSASATDRAGNVGNGSTSFTLQVTFASLCRLTSRFELRSDLATAMCYQLTAASLAAARGDAVAKAGAIGAYKALVLAQMGKTLTAANAAVLVRLVDAL